MIEYIISMQLSDKKIPLIASTLGHRFNQQYAPYFHKSKRQTITFFHYDFTIHM
jgi:hypothetical protein